MSVDPATPPTPPAAPVASPPAPQPTPTPTPPEPRIQVDGWDEYKTFIEDTQRLSDRRQAANNIYLSVNSLLLGAVALLVQLGGLDQWVFLPIVMLIAIAGWFICRDWKSLLLNYRKLLDVRFRELKKREERFDGSFQMYHVEGRDLDYDDTEKGFWRIEINLPAVFRFVYVVGVLILAAAIVIERWGVIAPFLRTTLHLPV